LTLQINGETKIYAIIGQPVEHTVSPLLHNSAFGVEGINAAYVAFRVHPESLSQAVDGLRSLGVGGFNVTLPHKIAIIPLLDEIDPSARIIGAVNTVKNDGGRLIGYNTDGEGALMALKTANVRLDGRVFILGAGGAARAIASTLVDHVNEIVIYNRTEGRALELSSVLSRRSRFPILGKKLDYRLSSEKLTDGDIIINTTSVGMYPDVDNSPIDPNIINGKVTVFDAIYNPYKTKLLEQAEVKGAKIVLGVNMLVYQAVKSFEIWTERTVDADVFFKAAMNALGRH
jgi:shikimate dehydrogenase